MVERMLESKAIGAMPIVNRVIRRLGIEEEIDKAVDAVLTPRGRKAAVPHGRVLCVVIRNLVTSRLPLYRFQDWVAGFVPEQLGLTPDESLLFHDDRVGKSLDWFYKVDRGTLVTRVVVDMAKRFNLDLSQFHSDTTSLTFFGEYLTAAPGCQSPFIITLGRNKDHRDDLKQLVFSLCVSRDGAVPVHHQVFDGNTTDDNIHIGIWNTLRSIVGHPNFTYVADCKLDNETNLRHIAGNGGTFVTVMPANHMEYSRFEEWIQSHEPPWEELIRRPDSRREDGPPQVFRGYEDPLLSSGGFRIIWIHSSDKARLDRESREGKIERAARALDALRPRLGRRGLKTEKKIREAVDEILKVGGVGRWLAVEVRVIDKPSYKQTGPGRPGKDTEYRREMKHEFELSWRTRPDTVQWDSRMDGIFPLEANSKSASPKEILEIYKFQPYLEKRNEQLKNVLNVVPMWLKSPERIASFLTLMFLALLVSCLIEREIRNAMRDEELSSLPIYPEERECQSPTTEKVLQLFDGIRRSRLFEDGTLVDSFWDALTPVQREVLRLLRVPRNEYGAG